MKDRCTVSLKFVFLNSSTLWILALNYMDEFQMVCEFLDFGCKILSAYAINVFSGECQQFLSGLKKFISPVNIKPIKGVIGTVSLD